MSKCWVSGAQGFVGTHLIELLKEQGNEVYGFDIKDGRDFRDYEAVRASIDYYRPDKIFHIGAQAYVPESFIDPWRAFDTNTVGSLNILEAVRRIGLKTRIHLCGSSEEYGDAAGPVDEDSLPNPLSPYAISKLAMDHLGKLYARSYNMNVVITRTFNHCGPGRGEQYAESSWAKQIVQIERGELNILRHGDLTTTRNYTDVRDIVRAYTLAIDLPSDVYNICSGQNMIMSEVLDTLIHSAAAEIPTEIDITLFRPTDFSFNKPSCEKFTKFTGWKPEIDFNTTLKDILDYWRNELHGTKT